MANNICLSRGLTMWSIITGTTNCPFSGHS